jgi:hypothetical protein
VKAYLLALLVLLAMGAPAYAAADESSAAAAEKLLEVMHMNQTLERTIDRSLDVQLKKNPALVTYKDVMRRFLDRYMSYESLKPDLVKIYANAFTSKELAEITAFYQTPTGRKALEMTPELAAEGAQLGIQRVREHVDELKQMIDAENKRLMDAQEQAGGVTNANPAGQVPDNRGTDTK